MRTTTRTDPGRQARLDRLFGALSDRTRRAILEQLARGPAPVTELAAPFRMSLPAVSRHLKVLERVRLIERRVDGRVHRCTLAPGPLEELERWLEAQRAFWQGSLKSLARYVEAGEEKPARQRSKP